MSPRLLVRRQAHHQPHEARARRRAQQGEAGRVRVVGLGEDLDGGRTEEHAAEEAQAAAEEFFAARKDVRWIP